MSTYAPATEAWHELLPGECDCEPAWKGRGLVDDRCHWHQIVDVVELLKDLEWIVEPPK